jgi:hypothetical protein
MKRATSPQPAGAAASASTSADVAHLVAGSAAPTWLAEHFEQWAPSQKVDRHVEKKQPKRTAMKKRLAEVAAAASLLRDALNDTPTREFLEIMPGGRIEYHGLLDRILPDLAERAERASASSALSAQDGTTKAGRTRAMPPGALSAKVFCAALIAETWAYFHSGDPPPRNQRAARAADALWRGSGGETTGWGSDPLKSWRPYFEQARQPSLTEIRKEMRRHLIERESQTKLLSM